MQDISYIVYLSSSQSVRVQPTVSGQWIPEGQGLRNEDEGAWIVEACSPEQAAWRAAIEAHTELFHDMANVLLNLVVGMPPTSDPSLIESALKRLERLQSQHPYTLEDLPLDKAQAEWQALCKRFNSQPSNTSNRG